MLTVMLGFIFGLVLAGVALGAGSLIVYALDERRFRKHRN